MNSIADFKRAMQLGAGEIMKITTLHLQGMFKRFHHAIGSPDGLRLDTENIN